MIVKRAVLFLLRFYWIVAIGLFIVLESFAPPDRSKVFSVIMKIPLLAENPVLLHLCVILGDFIIAIVSAYLTYAALKILKKKGSYLPFCAALLVILGFTAFLRPVLAKSDAVWVAELLKMFFILLALWGIYQLDWGTAFSVWAVSYLVLLIPPLMMSDIPASGSQGVLKHTTVLSDVKSLKSSLHNTGQNITAHRRQIQDSIKRLLGDAEKGDVQAQYALALAYQEAGPVDGQAPESALAEAYKWLSKASDQGLVDAQVDLGDFYLEGRGIPINPAEAAQLYRTAAEKGNTDAEARLGWIYSHGLGVGMEWGEEALKHYTNAVHGDSGFALWGLADMYLKGNGVSRNHELGMSYLSKAVDKGYAPAMTQLGLLMFARADNSTTENQGLEYIHQAARSGDAQAQYLFMAIHTEGVGVSAWPGRARWWGDRLSGSAHAGYADSQWYWGRALEDGLVGHADPSQAATWISQSANKGYSSALRSQGDYLAYGLAGKRDPVNAIVAYQTAAQFDAKAMWELIVRYRNGTDVPRNPVKGDFYLNQLRTFSSHGDAAAEYYLADIYRNGIILPQNSRQALGLYQLSAEGGMGASYFRLAEMSENGRRCCQR